MEGSEANRKLTTAEDLAMARNRRRQPRMCARGRASTCIASPPAIMSGCAASGSRTPTRLEGHSDADVGLHALTDALLGAIADGDIGQHFPNTDPRWKGAASHVFLAEAARRVRERGGTITNVDVTLLCEAPKIAPHREAMRARIAEILGIDIGRVAVKATTTEGLGFTGRREGIAAMATATVVLR